MSTIVKINKKLDILKEEYIARHIKLLKLEFMGQFDRRERIPKSLMKGEIIGTRRRGRPRRRCIQDVEQNFKNEVRTIQRKI